MKIISMSATFGRLDRAELRPGRGLTLIEAPNEGGKSTWCAFWRTMLYGIDTRDRDKKGYLADKNRFQPWSGAPMEGELTAEWQGQQISVRRGPRGAVPFGSFAAVRADTGEPVPGLTSRTCGEMLTGVGREVFERSAFLSSGSLAVTAAPELERRVAALVSSGQEDISYSEAEDTLKEWLRRRRHNRSVGLIPHLETELSDVNGRLSEQEDLTGRISVLESECSRLEQERSALTGELELHEKLARRDLDRRFSDAAAELSAAEQKLAALEEKGSLPPRDDLLNAQGELSLLDVLRGDIEKTKGELADAQAAVEQTSLRLEEGPFAGLTPQQAEQQAEEKLAARDELLRKAGLARRLGILFPAAGLATGAVLLAVPSLPYSPVLAAVCFAAGLLLGGAALLRVRSLRRDAQNAVSSPEELNSALGDYLGLCRARDDDSRRCGALKDELSRRLGRQSGSLAALLDFVRSFAPGVRDEAGCSAALKDALEREHSLSLAQDEVRHCRKRRDDLAAQGARERSWAGELPVPEHTQDACRAALSTADQRLRSCRDELERARGALSSMGDPAALSARRDELEEALSRRQEELQALTLALDTLGEAGSKLRSRFSPELNALAGDYLSRLTGERYTRLSLDRELQSETVRQGDVLPRSSLYLSQGTLDQLYLAVRLAVCRLCLPERPPLVLDDALIAFDDQRLKLALDLLLELSQEQQILLFTCQSREADLLADDPRVTRLRLS